MMIEIKDIMIFPAPVVKPHESIDGIAKLMTREKMSAVLVTCDDGSFGILSETDILTKVVAAGKDSAQVTAVDIMTYPIISVSDSLPANDAFVIMHENNFNHLPIKCEDQQEWGLVSIKELLACKISELEKTSVTDGLTGLYNKTFTHSQCIAALMQSLRDMKPATFAMCDIDFFKKVNDGFGHAAGDAVIKQLAQILKSMCRQSDIVGRVGGEEFLVLLRSCQKTDADLWAKNLLAAVNHAVFEFNGTRIPVSISIGTVSVVEKWEPGMAIETLTKRMIEKADQALYYSKHHGRNQHNAYEDISAPPK